MATSKRSPETHLSGTLTVEETARYFSISTPSVWRLLRDGTLPRVKIGGRTLVRRVDAERLIDASVVAA